MTASHYSPIVGRWIWSSDSSRQSSQYGGKIVLLLSISPIESLRAKGLVRTQERVHLTFISLSRARFASQFPNWDRKRQFRPHTDVHDPTVGGFAPMQRASRLLRSLLRPSLKKIRPNCLWRPILECLEDRTLLSLQIMSPANPSLYGRTVSSSPRLALTTNHCH
jgi:hypothetical protein